QRNYVECETTILRLACFKSITRKMLVIASSLDHNAPLYESLTAYYNKIFVPSILESRSAVQLHDQLTKRTSNVYYK
ncbi:hypothetical protein GJ496_010082, partial [Pomphorhynchus laevis]